MTRHKVYETGNVARLVKVYRDSATVQYVARLYVDGTLDAMADYFTDDKQDAIDTANHMAVLKLIRPTEPMESSLQFIVDACVRLNDAHAVEYCETEVLAEELTDIEANARAALSAESTPALKFTGIEEQIIRATIAALLAENYLLSVNDGEETVLKNSTDADTIFAAMRTTCEDYLYAVKSGQRYGWVLFIHGNGGDIISDYTVNLGPGLKPVHEAIDAFDIGA